MISGSLIDVEHLIDVVDAVLRGGSSMSIPSVTVARGCCAWEVGRADPR